jgi:Ricin-type beta-trefoil lectin domain-like
LFLVASLNRALWLYPLRNLELVRRPARLHLQHQNRSGGRQVPMVERRVGSTRSNDRPNLGYTSRRGAAIFPTAGCGRVAPLPAVTAARGWSCRTAARARIEGHQTGFAHAPNRRWDVIDRGAGEFVIIVGGSNEALDVAGGSTDYGPNVIQYRWHGGDNRGGASSRGRRFLSDRQCGQRQMRR